MKCHVYKFSDKTNNFDILGQNLPKNGFCCQNFKNLCLDLKSASLRYYAYQFSDKSDNFKYLGPNLPKTGFWGRNSKYLSLDLESASLRYYTHEFADKTNNFEFLGTGLSKNKFWGRNFKNYNSGFWINTFTISCVPIFSQNGQHFCPITCNILVPILLKVLQRAR